MHPVALFPGDKCSSTGAQKCTCTPKTPIHSIHIIHSAAVKFSSGEPAKANLLASWLLAGAEQGQTYLAKGEKRAVVVAKAACSIAAEATALGGGEAAALGIAETASAAAAKATASRGAAAATRGIVVLAVGVVQSGGHRRLAGVGLIGGACGHWQRVLAVGAVFARSAAQIISCGLCV